LTLRAKWQFMNQSVTSKKLYRSQLRFGPYNIYFFKNCISTCIHKQKIIRINHVMHICTNWKTTYKLRSMISISPFQIIYQQRLKYWNIAFELLYIGDFPVTNFIDVLDFCLNTNNRTTAYFSHYNTCNAYMHKLKNYIQAAINDIMCI
jgi:hypothetical protein